MRELFKSKVFILIFVAVIIFVSYIATSVSTSSYANAGEDITGTLILPFQKAFTGIKNGFNSFTGYFVGVDKVRKENEDLKAKVHELEQNVLTKEFYATENERLKKYLGIAEERPDFKKQLANVIARDPNNLYEVITIDKGSHHGIAPKDTVITAEGLVGYVIKTGSLWSKVVTIIDPSVTLGAYISSSREAGILEGDANLMGQGMCKVTMLSSEKSAIKGDTVFTSGLGGIFPKGIPIGKVTELLPDTVGITYYAKVEPSADFKKLKEVFVITNFEDYGGVNEDK